MRYTIEQLDNMEGLLFENAVADLLFHNGYRDVKVTQGSGDYGIDILARRKNMKYAIQCKRYKTKVSVKAVQEAGLGADFYHCDAAAVITNSEFTKPAENLAKTTGVRLWGRPFLQQLIDEYDDEYDDLDPVNAAIFVREKSTKGQPAPKSVSQKPLSDKTINSKKKTSTSAKSDTTLNIIAGIIVLIFIIFIFYWLNKFFSL